MKGRSEWKFNQIDCAKISLNEPLNAKLCSIVVFHGIKYKDLRMLHNLYLGSCNHVLSCISYKYLLKLPSITVMNENHEMATTLL